MVILHIALYALLATSLVFAIVELGLSAYVASAWSGDVATGYDFYYGYTYGHVSAPAIVSFLVFCSVWTVLVTVAAFVLSFVYTRKGATGKLSTILGIAFAVVYGITMVFWLAAFADIASQLNGYNGFNDYLNAVLAFAVLLWLLFVALLVLSILALCGVLNSDWVGYRSMRGARTEKSAPAAAPEVPMSTDPVQNVTSPSELSSRDAEVLHNQPNNQPLSPSSPSAVASELSGDNVHEKQAGHA